uniref:T9SS type A sorting domain-containing protein n=1 Tax=Flavobacterium sp. TaxID=239 RepID=UPI00404A6C75
MESSIQGNVAVFSLTGQKLLARDFQQESFSLDLSQLNASYYLLTFTNKNGGSATIKVLKK